jgi:hypothetical protein
MPAHDCLWANDDEIVLPPGPEPAESDPECSVGPGQPRPAPSAGVYGELLAQGQLDDGSTLATPD